MISADWRSIWMIRSRKVSSNIRFWLSITGYDSNDRSVSMRIYLLYLIAFFSAWTLAVMFLISNFILTTLSPFFASQGIAFSEFVITIFTLLLILWSLYSIHRATLQSPLVFSEDDAHLICQTPADRRFVTLAWFLGEWPSSALPVLAVAVTVGIVLLDLDIYFGIRTLSVGNMAIATLKPLFIVIPLHLGLLAVVWVIGVFRLQRDAERKKVMRSLRVISVFSAVGLFVVVLGNILLPSSLILFQPLLSFLRFPLEAAFHEGSWVLGIAVSIGMMTTSLAILWHISDKLNLSRAAQETRRFQAQRVALMIGDFERIRELKDRERIGSGHTPSRIPTLPGAWVLTWKDVVQSLRTLTISRLWSWLVILFVTIAGVFLTDGASLFVVVCWSILVGGLTSARLGNDLSKWWLLSSLPLTARHIILHVVARPVIGIIAITWIAMGIISLLGSSISPIIVCAVPFAVIGISFSYVFDMLRKSDVSLLLDGRQPYIGPVGLVLCILCIAVPAAINFIIEHNSISPIAGVPAVILIGLFLAISLLHLSESQFRRVG